MTEAHAPSGGSSLRRVLRRRVWRARRALPGSRVARLPEWTGPATTLPPIIVGGTGRSGTTITGRLLGMHPDYHMIPFEVKFLSSKGGLADLLLGRTTIVTFERLLLTKWFDLGRGKGLFQITDPAAIRAATRELDADLDRDPILAARRFVHRLLRSARRRGRRPGLARGDARDGGGWPGSSPRSCPMPGSSTWSATGATPHAR